MAELQAISGFAFVAGWKFGRSQRDTGASCSSLLKRTATKLSKICNDRRLLSSGPRGGLCEIPLPPLQPGSSIMPGKVNPVIPEVVNRVAFQ
ncbi:lyase family protein [Mesorhizobium sp. L103C131B0]|uniref:lyase family protein n=1 Tax=Mesorhizobium sp. L103C131B0 TaxID=1287089 RepID=UPI002473B03F|nr:lyase family protein [Mesorhizobium sp. L103C131B0]